MSEDLIKRSDAIEALRKLGHELVVIDKVCSLGIAGEFIDAVRAVPSADRPKGECEFCKGGGFIGAKILLGNDGEWHAINYCPNCGCRMKGADDED